MERGAHICLCGSFQTEQTSWGIMVVSIHGLAGNAEDRTYWRFLSGSDALQEGGRGGGPMGCDPWGWFSIRARGCMESIWIHEMDHRSMECFGLERSYEGMGDMGGTFPWLCGRDAGWGPCPTAHPIPAPQGSVSTSRRTGSTSRLCSAPTEPTEGPAAGAIKHRLQHSPVRVCLCACDTMGRDNGGLKRTPSP